MLVCRRVYSIIPLNTHNHHYEQLFTITNHYQPLITIQVVIQVLRLHNLESSKKPVGPSDGGDSRRVSVRSIEGDVLYPMI